MRGRSNHTLKLSLIRSEAKAEERLALNGGFPHYMGALLVIPRGAYSFGRMEVFAGRGDGVHRVEMPNSYDHSKSRAETPLVGCLAL
jgi:hypothetical protein